MDGATLLTRVQQRQPDAVRIVLSGHAELDVVARASAVAHRLLGKPCDLDELARMIERSSELGDMARAERLRRAASDATSLPSPPQLYVELTALLAEGSPSMQDVGRLVERDIATAAKVLQLTNSAFFGLSRSITRIDEAVNYLGIGTLKALILSAQALTAFRPVRPIEGFSIEAHERHGTLVAALARRIVPRGAAQDEAFAAALLHDIGWLVLAAQEPDHVAEVLAGAELQGLAPAYVELESGLTTHADVGAHLLGLWGLPDGIVAAVARHHVPAAPERPGLDTVAAVHIADALLDERKTLDPGYVEALGVADQLDGWRAVAAELAGA